MRGSGTYKEKERQKAVLSGTMVVGLAVNCGMLPWLFKEHLPVHLSQSVVQKLHDALHQQMCILVAGDVY
jgi:hypothetical protein